MANKPWLGKKLSEEHKRKISEGLKGHKTSKETREKIGRANSIALLGNTPWNKGKKGVMPEPWNKGTKGVCEANSGSFKEGEVHHNMPHTEEAKKKMGEAVKNAWEEGKFDNRFFDGRSEETKRKISESLREGEYLKCPQCNKKFYVSPSEKDKRKYCSKKCYGKSNSGENHKWWNNGHTKMGKNNPNWKGGTVANYDYKHLKNKKYKEWRKSVFERDNYKCQECGKNGYLQAHHIRSYTYYPDSRYETSNGMTVCISCHREIHFNKEV